MLKLKSCYELIYQIPNRYHQRTISQIGLIWFVSRFGLSLDGGVLLRTSTSVPNTWVKKSSQSVDLENPKMGYTKDLTTDSSSLKKRKRIKDRFQTVKEKETSTLDLLVASTKNSTWSLCTAQLTHYLNNVFIRRRPYCEAWNDKVPFRCLFVKQL